MQALKSHAVQASKNLAHLGSLDVVRPGGSVNLGNLYTPPKHQTPFGWAYFEDGSVFIAPEIWLSHEHFQAHMRIAAHFVKSPSPKMQARQEMDPLSKRLIIVDKAREELAQDHLSLFARNAQDNQKVTVLDPKFEHIILDLDSNRSYPLSARFEDVSLDRIPNQKTRNRYSAALLNFRGTLVDGVLQPNVRIGNGLRLSRNPRLGLNGPQEKKLSQALDPSDHNVEYREASIIQKERNLIRMEELLRYKRKVWIPEQELARATRSPRLVPRPSQRDVHRSRYCSAPDAFSSKQELGPKADNTGDEFPSLDYGADMPENQSAHDAFSSDREPAPQPLPDNAGDDLPSGEFDVLSLSAPRVLAKLRSRVQVPRRRRPR